MAKTGAWTVNSLMKIADFLNWKKIIVASLLMGFVSSMPEFFVGITAALFKKPELSFGNVIGSNIVLLTLIIGVAVLLGGKIKLKGKTIQRSSSFACLYAFLPLLLLFDGEASRVDGAILILALVFYLRELVLTQKRFKKTFLGQEESEKPVKEFRLFFKHLGIFLVSTGLMLCSAWAIVFSAGRLAQTFNLPPILIGALVVALGTSLPELSFGIRSVIMKEKEMILGNIFGSIVANSTLVLGITCLISPFRIYYSFPLYLSGFIFSAVVILAFLLFSKTHNEISRKEAKILLFFYALFFIVQLWLK